MLTVRHYPDPVLTHRTHPVKRIDRSFHKLVKEMFDTMYEEQGVGLAAPQVGEGLRMCVVNCTGDSDDELVLVNPVIVESSGEATSEEGCLSVPGVRTNVSRPARVKVRAYDAAGHELELDADGLEARALQHEIDHLEGRLFFQRLNEAARMTIKHQIERLEREFGE
jgi:peptide deformylase